MWLLVPFINMPCFNHQISAEMWTRLNVTKPLLGQSCLPVVSNMQIIAFWCWAGAITGECLVRKCPLEFRKHSHVNVGQCDAR